jgi:hypothetical protein
MPVRERRRDDWVKRTRATEKALTIAGDPIPSVGLRPPRAQAGRS